MTKTYEVILNIETNDNKDSTIDLMKHYKFVGNVFQINATKAKVTSAKINEIDPPCPEAYMNKSGTIVCPHKGCIHLADDVICLAREFEERIK
jgi:hypothetical protein